MQTTLRINDEIYRRAKAKSSELGLSLTRFFEEAVEERLLRLEERSAEHFKLPVSSVSGKMMSLEEMKSRMEQIQLEDDLKSFD